VELAGVERLVKRRRARTAGGVAGALLVAAAAAVAIPAALDGTTRTEPAPPASSPSASAQGAACLAERKERAIGASVSPYLRIGGREYRPAQAAEGLTDGPVVAVVQCSLLSTSLARTGKVTADDGGTPAAVGFHAPGTAVHAVAGHEDGYRVVALAADGQRTYYTLVSDKAARTGADLLPDPATVVSLYVYDPVAVRRGEAGPEVLGVLRDTDRAQALVRALSAGPVAERRTFVRDEDSRMLVLQLVDGYEAYFDWRDGRLEETVLVAAHVEAQLAGLPPGVP
jgi:hypothetical protein